MWSQHLRNFLPHEGIRSLIPKMSHSHPKVLPNLFFCFKIPLTHSPPGKGIGKAGGVRSLVPKMSHSYPKVGSMLSQSCSKNVSKMFQSCPIVIPKLSRSCLKDVLKLSQCSIVKILQAHLAKGSERPEASDPIRERAWQMWARIWKY